MPISLDKQYETRNGYAVRIFALDLGGDYPVAGAAIDDDGKWRVTRWTADGRFHTDIESDEDLVEVKKSHKVMVWANVYHGKNGKPEIGGVHLDKKTADLVASSAGVTRRRCACVPITLEFKEGDGL